MPLAPEHTAFDPIEINTLVGALEGALHALRITRLDDPASELVAKLIFELALHGETDSQRLRDEAITRARERLLQLPGLFGSRAPLADPGRH